MEYRKLGRTDIEVSSICLGTMTWGEQNTEADAHEQLDYALEHGVNFIDTAEMYPVPPNSKTQGLTEKYKHPCGTWSNDDATIKWAGSMIIFDKLAKKGMRVVDLGAGDGPVAHIIADRGYDVVGVDVKPWSFGYQSLAVMVTKDAIEFVREYEDNSVDIFMDGCAVTHFNDSGDEETPNRGWRSIFEALKRVMKPGGYFICFSDIKCDDQTVIGLSLIHI